MAKKLFDEIVTIRENRQVNAKYRKLVFVSPELSRHVLPGQFLHVKVDPGRDPYLRRPFSYYRTQKNTVEILYEVLGHGTEVLSQKDKGDSLKIMGPLGNCFKADLKGKKRILVGGGIGVPPLINLAEHFPSEYLLMGTKSSAEVLPRNELKKVKAKVLYATEDGSVGVKGFVTVLLERIIKKEKPQNLFIQTCGPKPMMLAVMAMARQYGVQGEASWDEAMACGVGACLGCMVETTEGLKRACVDGPVFNFEELAVR